MRELMDRDNLENIIKFYEFVDGGRNSMTIDPSYRHYGFDDIDVDMSDNIDLWASNKEHIFKLFGSRLKIYKTLGGESLCNDTMADTLRNTFLEKEGHNFNVLIRLFLSYLPPAAILKNKLTKNMQILDVELKEGWKITKCFSFLDLNKKRVSKQQDLYSTFLQTLKVKGRLVLSIDPVDFYTMSVSRSGWSSCHHPGGGYGTGSIAYMNDSATMIAYVETDEKIHIEIEDDDSSNVSNIEMANKIWRQVVTINPQHDYVMQLRQYPNESEIYSKELADMIRELLEKEQSIEYTTEQVSMDDDVRAMQGRNKYLRRALYYCDYSNRNFGYYTLTKRHTYETQIDLQEAINEGSVGRTIVAEKMYCACGCGQVNYTNHAFVEESSYDDDDDEWEDDEWDYDE